MTWLNCVPVCNLTFCDLMHTHVQCAHDTLHSNSTRTQRYTFYPGIIFLSMQINRLRLCVLSVTFQATKSIGIHLQNVFSYPIRDKSRKNVYTFCIVVMLLLLVLRQHGEKEEEEKVEKHPAKLISLIPILSFSALNTLRYVSNDSTRCLEKNPTFLRVLLSLCLKWGSISFTLALCVLFVFFSLLRTFSRTFILT